MFLFLHLPCLQSVSIWCLPTAKSDCNAGVILAPSDSAGLKAGADLIIPRPAFVSLSVHRCTPAVFLLAPAFVLQSYMILLTTAQPERNKQLTEL